MKNILLTGGAGYIGSHTCLALLEKGYEIFCIDSYINSSRESLRRVNQLFSQSNNANNRLNIYEGDLRDEFFLNKIFEEAINKNKKIDSVIHFAGLKSVKESFYNPILYWDSNVYSSINLLKVMVKFECKTIVFSSSATIYGQSQKLKIDESCITNPIDPYGTTKMVIEKLLINLSSNQGEAPARIINIPNRT